MNGYLFILFIFLSHLVSAQKNVSRSCVEKVREFSRKADRLPLPEEGIIYSNYTQQIVMWDSINTPRINMEVKMMMNKDHLQYITPDLEVYQDEKDVFMIIHSKKKVIWSKSDLGDKQKSNNRIGNIAILKDSLFDLSTPLRCETFKKTDGKEKTRLVLKTNKGGRELFHIDVIEYVYDNFTESVESVITTFVPTYEIKRTVVNYKVNDPAYKGIKLNKPVSSKIINKNNLLAGKYKGYELLDNR